MPSLAAAYPQDLLVDFNKLRMKTLRRYAAYFHLPDRVSHRPEELAIMCAQHFDEHLHPDEDTTISNFEMYCARLQQRKKPRGTKEKKVPNGDSESNRKRQREAEIPPDTRVAARINGEWMLNRVIKFKKRPKVYRVEDADELSTESPALYDVPQSDVLPLPPSDEEDARRFPAGARVLALYPRTSTFYAATVVKRIEKARSKAVEYGLRFDDDEKDTNGKVKMKRVKALAVVEYRD